MKALCCLERGWEPGHGVRQVAGRVNFQGCGNPVSSQGGWRNVWGLAARLEQPDISEEQEAGGGVRGWKAREVTLPTSLPPGIRVPQAHLPFPPNPLPALLLQGKAGPTTCPHSPPDNAPESSFLCPPSIPLVAIGGLARRGAGGRLQATVPLKVVSSSWEGDREEQVNRGQGWERIVSGRRLAHRHATLGIRESVVGMGWAEGTKDEREAVCRWDTPTHY